MYTHTVVFRVNVPSHLLCRMWIKIGQEKGLSKRVSLLTNDKALYFEQIGFVIQWLLLLWCLLLYLDEQFGSGCFCCHCPEELAHYMPCTLGLERGTCKRTSTQGQLADNSRTSFSLKATHQESIGPASLYLAECRWEAWLTLMSD